MTVITNNIIYVTLPPSELKTEISDSIFIGKLILLIVCCNKQLLLHYIIFIVNDIQFDCGF